jgi:hypothetical protein
MARLSRRRLLEQAILAGAAGPALAQTLSRSVTPSSPEELDALIKSEAVRWSDVIRQAGIRPIE